MSKEKYLPSLSRKLCLEICICESVSSAIEAVLPEVRLLNPERMRYLLEIFESPVYWIPNYNDFDDGGGYSDWLFNYDYDFEMVCTSLGVDLFRNKIIAGNFFPNIRGESLDRAVCDILRLLYLDIEEVCGLSDFIYYVSDNRILRMGARKNEERSDRK